MTWRQSASRALLRTSVFASASISLVGLASCRCDDSQSSSQRSALLRKRTTLQAAASAAPPNQHPFPRRQTNTMTLDLIREQQSEILLRWERDEEGWRKLPARAWPPVQPDPDERKELQVVWKKTNCDSQPTTDHCQTLAFQMATTLVFYSLDPSRGLDEFRRLAELGNVDAMVACGVVLVEGLGVPVNEKEGIRFLQQAADQTSSQALYELATLYYVGIDGVVEEDEAKAFELFEKAAAQSHISALYMTADCLLNGEGTAQDVDRAVPLFYRAAESGHRFARQRIRELLAGISP